MLEPIFARSGLKEPFPSNADALYENGYELIDEIFCGLDISAVWLIS